MNKPRESFDTGADTLVPPSLTNASNSRLYHIYHTPFHHDYNVKTDDKTHVFHVDNSTWTPGKPDITFHAGTDKNGPIVSVCKFLHFSGDLKVGLGDPRQVNSVIWEDLTRESLISSKYRLTMTVQPQDPCNPSSRAHGQRRTFLWKRTRSVGVDGSSPNPLSSSNFKLVDERTKEIIAVFTSSGFMSYKKNGKLQINVNYGNDFDIMVLTSGIALYEKERRRGSGGGAGGGGGGGC